MSRYFAPITPDQLKQKIVEAYNKCEHCEEDVTVEEVYSGKKHISLMYLNEKVKKDLAKVTFDGENEYIIPRDFDVRKHDIIGINTLPNGMVFNGVMAGGDWEQPIFYIIYWDGKSLRGYIPTDGNPYNRSTKMAYGNDEEADGLSDAQDAFKNFGTPINKYHSEFYGDMEELDCDHESLEPDIEKIKQDIMGRILPK
jgi:hypothetical protein